MSAIGDKPDAYDQGVNVRVVQALAWHESISTPQRYIHYNESRLRAAVELV